MNTNDIIDTLLSAVLGLGIIIMGSVMGHAADISLDYEKSSLKGEYNSFFDSMSTRRIGVETNIPLSKKINIIIGAGQEKMSYNFFYGYTFIRQILILPDGTVVGSMGKDVYYRKSENLIGPYFKFRLCMKI